MEATLAKYGNNTKEGMTLVKFYAFVSLLLATMSLFASLVYNSILNAAAAYPIPPDAVQGKLVFQKNACIECHTVFGNGGYLGGDLTKVYDKTGDKELKDYLVQAPILTGAKKKRHVGVSEPEAEAIVAYLRYLNTINTLDWPLEAADTSIR